MDRYKLFQANERLAYFALHKYFSGQAFDEDLVQTAKLGLWKACLTYDPEKTRFTTYAVVCIRNEIFMGMRSKSPPCAASLDQAVSLEDGDGDALLDFLADARAGVAIQNAEFDLAQALAQCSGEQRQMLALKAAGRSQTEIGRKCGCTQSRVSRELRKARNLILGGAV